MHILEMQAAYGRLRATVSGWSRAEPDLRPNESGKSTWCSFIRTMLYGLPTRQSGPWRTRTASPLDREAMQGGWT